MGTTETGGAALQTIEVAQADATWSVIACGEIQRSFSSEERALKAALRLSAQLFDQGVRSVVELRVA
jgi:hypothetical protein